MPVGRSGVHTRGVYVISDRGIDDEAFLDSMWNRKGGNREGPDPIVRGTERRPRLWVVIARDANNTWRVRDVRAYTAEHAVAKYRNIFKIYEVVGVGLLGGSGHAVQWLRNGEWNE